MSIKRIIGIILFSIGIPLIAFGVRGMQTFNEARGMGEDITNFFTKNPMWNPLITFFGGAPQEKPLEYDSTDTTMLIIGILFTLAGILTVLIRRKRNFFDSFR